MNCCDDAGRCTNGKHGTPCAARGAYHRHVNTHTDAPARGIRFAPGAIEHHPHSALGTPQQRRELWRWLLLLGAGLGLCSAAAFGGLLAGAVLWLTGALPR